MDVSKDDLRDSRKELLETMRDGFAGIHDRLDTLNGRTRKNEIDIAVLQDRSDDAKKMGGIAGTIGGIVSGFVAGLIK